MYHIGHKVTQPPAVCGLGRDLSYPELFTTLVTESQFQQPTQRSWQGLPSAPPNMLIHLVTESQVTGPLSSSGRMQKLIYPDTPISRNASTPGHKVTIFGALNKEREKVAVRSKCKVLSLYRQHAAVLNAGGGTITSSLSMAPLQEVEPLRHRSLWLRYRAGMSFLIVFSR